MRLVRALVPQLVVLMGLVMLGAWLLRPPAALDSRFGTDDCRRIALVYPLDGTEISGAEDLLVAPDSDTVIVSAYDRRDLDRKGGLYSFSLWELGTQSTIKTKRFDGPGSEVIHPHGIGLSPDGQRLAVINHAKGGATEVLIGDFRFGWQPDTRIAGKQLCRANDLQFAGPDTIEVSLDRADCGISLRDIAPWGATGKIVRWSGGEIETVRRDLKFANGLQGPAVAETRGGRISWPNGDAIDLPGGPDNLSLGPDGRLVAALHPNLFLTFLALRDVFEAVPSRIVLVDPTNGEIEVLFDDPSGQVFSAASSAVVAGDQLLAGSATDRGVLLCEARR